MLFKGIGRTFSTENNCQFVTIGAFWDELAAKYGRVNLGKFQNCTVPESQNT